MTAPPTPERAWYVYGILPGDVELSEDVTGVGDPPAPVRLVRSGDLAALVSEVDPASPLGSPEDLVAHQEMLDASAAEVPVLPMRFGAVLASEEAVTTELLDEHHDGFTAALEELEGRAQYVVKGRYAEPAILGEVLSENQQAERLRREIRGMNPDATHDARIRLGEIINNAISAKREADTHLLGDAVAGHCVASVVREPSHERDAVHVALLVGADQEKEMEKAIDGLAQRWAGRVEVRLLGPMAAYDFVETT
jgi:Gas vesicle synthesis protein GvpL/GvpF